MNVEPINYRVDALVEALDNGSLLRNDEYQRGEAWTPVQRASFIDSLFRQYPLPAFFLHEIHRPGLDKTVSKKWEIVDGQQRLYALRDFVKGKFSLLDVSDRSKLRLPKSVRSKPAPWAGKFYNDLSQELQAQFNGTELSVFVILPGALDDEIRDLFIRLQSGTALTRQQIRDAWPGSVGPFIESLAGKLNKPSSVELFGLVDKRGQRSEDEDQRDLHVADRQLAAQLLRIFVARANDPYAFPSISATELDSMYHELTDFARNGAVAEQFKAALKSTADILYKVIARLPHSRSKIRRRDVSAVMMFVQDVARNPLLKLDQASMTKLAANIVAAESAKSPAGRSTSAAALKEYYEWWRKNVADGVVTQLDPRRTFDGDQKVQIRERTGGRCGVCDKEVDEKDAEYDHFPVPYRDGGQTEVHNGRLVHSECHARGRPRVE